MEHSLFAISPLDGRYESSQKNLRQYFSEAALMKYCTKVEIEWFIFLCQDLELERTKQLSPSEIESLRSIYEKFDGIAAQRVKSIESATNHDVKAIEYFIKENIENTPLHELSEFIHFGCTSEDINNLAYSLMLKDAIAMELLPVLSGLEIIVHSMSKEFAAKPMMSRTHGQSATPTTMGKELANVASRLNRQVQILSNQEFLGKINGAVGNFNAHLFVYPQIDWPNETAKFLKTLGLTQNKFTTQIEPHDFIAEICDTIKRINTILIDFNRDIWTYISLDYFKQTPKEGEVGSSTMPHKVNPIDFENSEGNLGLANSLLIHFSEKLPISRLQRDLTDSTVFRNLGVGIGYSILAYKATIRGLNKLSLNEEKLNQDLEDNWILLAEPIQMLLRSHKIPNAYEKLKDLTRGKKVGKEEIHTFIKNLDIPNSAKDQMLQLTPQNYIGAAAKLAQEEIK
jgi:adenylosuccinate lyase